MPKARRKNVDADTSVPNVVAGDRLQHGLGERVARQLTDFTGSNAAVIAAVVVVLAWAVSGPFFDYSSEWQLVINTGTTIITFLMVFLIQRAQNKDSLAIHLKLDELVAAHKGASNRLVSAEDLSEHDLEMLRVQYRKLMRAAAREQDRNGPRSVDNQRGPGHTESNGTKRKTT